ncbi:hypothetical protein CBR_g56618 [Chara braunii]|uniref:Uncharacterized protein n=1 Tax=Chara braunii TaxID=69332 RepID=A0A388MDS1_CHABU|nr:hypothetical protein CBR_g56618 [Chara braunii]|eukprot:GBG92653.1 hypothetical protein CBR_g56618 [Chara braunii]
MGGRSAPHSSSGSGSTQDWMGRHYQQREVGTSGQSYSTMLEGGLDGGHTEIVDLDFGLPSGTPGVGANTCASNHVGATTVGQTSVSRVGVVGVGGRSSGVGGTTDGCRPAPSICGGGRTAGDPPSVVLPTHSATPLPALRQRAVALAANTRLTSTSPPEEMGRQAWASCRQQMRRAIADNITNGVSRMSVGRDTNADDTRRASGEESLNQILIARRNQKMRKTWRFDPLVCVVDGGVDADIKRRPHHVAFEDRRVLWATTCLKAIRPSTRINLRTRVPGEECRCRGILNVGHPLQANLVPGEMWVMATTKMEGRGGSPCSVQAARGVLARERTCAL